MLIFQNFSTALAQLGPFGPQPRLVVAVSGGADSTALALLTQAWAAAHQGRVLGLIVDHGLRAESAAEARLTQARLAARGVAAEILTLTGLGGSGVQAQARAARYAALGQAARAKGFLHLLLGHHAADQAETVAMRAARGPNGLEGMAAWSARHDILLLRPLLAMNPADLRAFLRAEDMPWVEDPSNANPAFERVRLRQSGAGRPAANPAARQQSEREVAAFLAVNVTLRPEGFAVIKADAAPPAALAALLRVIGGADYNPPQDAVAALASALRPASLGGVRIVPAGRLGPGWLLAREFFAVAPPAAAKLGALWDGRFRLVSAAAGPGSIGALGEDSVKFRKINDLPSVVLQAMPCLRAEKGEISFAADAIFAPPMPAASHPFWG